MVYFCSHSEKGRCSRREQGHEGEIEINSVTRIAVVVVAHGKHVEAFPIGARHLPLQAEIEGLRVKRRAATDGDVGATN